MGTLIHAIILGIVQGITEFLPISSTGHLVLIPRLFGWQDMGLSFDVALHVGTLLALIAFFWRDWIDIICSGFGRPQSRHGDARAPMWLLWGIIVACIPAAVAGKLWEKKFDAMLTDPSKDHIMMLIIAIAMITVSFLIYAADHYGRKRRMLAQMNFTDWILIGLAQACALIPGVSRSGATISAGLARDLDRDAAARFSFLLSTPVILGAAAMQAKHILHIPAAERLPFAAGVISSAIVGYLVIAFLLSYIRKHNLNVFVWYRIAFGLILLALLGTRVI